MEITIIKDEKIVEYSGDKEEALSYCQELGLTGFKLIKAIPWNLRIEDPGSFIPRHPRSYRETLKATGRFDELIEEIVI